LRWAGDSGITVELPAQESVIQIIQWSAGTPTILASGGFTIDGMWLRVVISGNSITVYQNGSSVLAATSSFQNTVTTHGLVAQGINGRIDEWLAYATP
jgi:hypothetical protein